MSDWSLAKEVWSVCEFSNAIHDGLVSKNHPLPCAVSFKADFGFQVSMKEWEIPWDDLKMNEQLGTGHFGTVYGGYWHGDVDIKVLNMDYLGDEKMLESFKAEVG